MAGSVRCGSLTSSGVVFRAVGAGRGARVRLRFTADGAGAYGRRAQCVRLSGGGQRPLPGAPFFRRVPGQRRRRGRDGGLERCSRDRRTSERGDSRDLGQPRGAHPVPSAAELSASCRRTRQRSSVSSTQAPAVRASARSRATTSSWRMSRPISSAASTSASGTAAGSGRSNSAKIWRLSPAPSAAARRPARNKYQFRGKL